jgi:hypothetical protein
MHTRIHTLIFMERERAHTSGAEGAPQSESEKRGLEGFEYILNR